MSDLQVRGPLFGGTGSASPFTADITGAQRTTDAHGRYNEAASRGFVFWLDSGSVTVGAGNATGGALGTLAFIVGFWNPPNSGKIISLVKCIQSTVSGTPGGPLIYNYVVPGATRISSASTGTIRSGYLSSVTAGASIATPLVNVAVATLPADTTTTGTIIGQAGGPAAVAAGAGINSTIDELAGAIIVPPGTAFGLTSTATGTSHIVRATLVWEEISLLA